jgi:hypothetical protein
VRKETYDRYADQYRQARRARYRAEQKEDKASY